MKNHTIKCVACGTIFEKGDDKCPECGKSYPSITTYRYLRNNDEGFRDMMDVLVLTRRDLVNRKNGKLTAKWGERGDFRRWDADVLYKAVKREMKELDEAYDYQMHLLTEGAKEDDEELQAAREHMRDEIGDVHNTLDFLYYFFLDPSNIHYKVSLKDAPDKVVVLSFPVKRSPMGVKDRACSSGYFPWSDYGDLRIRRIGPEEVQVWRGR